MDALRTAFSAHHALQCGFCTPGMLVTARDIIARLGDVPEARIRDELSGNLCRCTGYVGIIAAIRAVGAGRSPLVTPPRAVPSSMALPPVPAAAKRLPPTPVPTTADGRPTLTERITLAASPDVVWVTLADLHRVASCVPGAEITAIDGDSITGRLRVALGPIRASFAGQGSVTRDDTTRSGQLRGQGRDTGTGSSVQGEARYTVRPATAATGAGSELEVTISWRLTGALAQFARTALVQSLARQVLQAFTANLEALIAGNAPRMTRPLGVFGLLWSLIRAHLFGR
jgi:carbon-monoxide dehydrogenase small subunit